MMFFVRRPLPKGYTVRIHPAHPARQHGRAGASVVIPMLGVLEPAELRDNLDILNGMNPERQKIDQAKVEEAIEKKVKGREQAMSTRELLDMGLRPGERRRVKGV